MLGSKLMAVAEGVTAALPEGVSELTGITRQNFRGGRTLQWPAFLGWSQGSAKVNILCGMRSGVHRTCLTVVGKEAPEAIWLGRDFPPFFLLIFPLMTL